MKLERPSSDLSKTVSNIIFGQNLHILEYVEVTVPKSQDLGTVRNLKNGIKNFCHKTNDFKCRISLVFITFMSLYALLYKGHRK